MRKLTTIILILAFLALLSSTVQAFTLTNIADILELIAKMNGKTGVGLPGDYNFSYDILCGIIDRARICKFE